MEGEASMIRVFDATVTSRNERHDPNINNTSQRICGFCRAVRLGSFPLVTAGWCFWCWDMNSAPAFQFYPDDFLGGTVSMTNEEKGLYITALCIQWNKGGVSEEEMARLSRGMAVPSLKHVKGKFKHCPDRLFRNQRLEHERRKQREYRENRKKSGELGAKSRWHSHGIAITQPMAKNGSPSPSPSPIRGGEGSPPSEGKLGISERITLEQSLKRIVKDLDGLKDADIPQFVERRKELKAEKTRLLGILGLKA